MFKCFNSLKFWLNSLQCSFFHFHLHLIPLDWIINYFLWILINNHFDLHTNYYQWTQPTRTTITWVIWVLVLIPLHLMMLMLMLMLYNFDNESSCHWSFILIMIFNRLVFIYLIIILIISLINLFYFILIHMKKLSICLVGCEGHF